MRKRLLYALLAAGLVLVALVAFTSTATAEKRSFQVRLADGSVVTVTVDVPPGTPIDEIPLPGELIAELPGPDDVPAPAAPSVVEADRVAAARAAAMNRAAAPATETAATTAPRAPIAAGARTTRDRSATPIATAT